MLSQTAEYALRAMVGMALSDEGKAVRGRDLAELTGVPYPYLAKILGTLVRAELLTSRKGRGGGFLLARAPDQIRLLDVLEASDALGEEGYCGFGWGECDTSDPCPMHGAWSRLKEGVYAWARENTLADIDRDTLSSQVAR